MIVGIIGAGTMGAGIAQVCLVAGHDVLLHDVDEAAIDAGRQRIARGLERLVARDRLDVLTARDALRDRLRDAHGLAAIADEAELVIEAAIEDLELKRTLFRALGEAAPAETILATNTSALSVAEIASVTNGPERVIGLHFFNPAPVMALVEVITTPWTAAHALATAAAFVGGLGKTPVVCRDSPGFIVNRVNRPFTLEALRLVESGRAVPGDVDSAVEAAGYPMGPFRLMDLVGIDVNLAVAQALYDAFDGAARFRPSPLQEAMVEAGTLGRKSGRGFYRYDEDGKRLEPALASVRDPEDDFVRPIELAIINEAYHAAGEDVADPSDIDLALKLGAGHPIGPFERAGDLGLRTVVDGLGELSRSGSADAVERFAIAPALWSLATL